MSEKEDNKGVDFGFDLTALNNMSEQFGDRFTKQPSTPDDDNEPTDVDDINRQQLADKDEPQPTDDAEKSGENVSDEPNNDNLENPSSQETDDTSSLLTPYAKMLVEEGLLDLNLEDFDGTAESIRDAERNKIINEINNGVSEYKNTLPSRIKTLIDNYEDGVPLEDLLAVDRSKTTLESITEDKLLESIDLQKSIAKEYYKETTRFSDSRIDKEIERLDQLGELEEETKGYLSELKSLNEQKEEVLRQQAELKKQEDVKQQQQALETFTNTLKETKEIIPGMNINDSVKDNIYKSLTTVVDIDEYGQPLNKIAKARAEDPIGFEIKLAYLFEITKGMTDWSALNTAGKKAAIKDFETAAAKANLDSHQIPKRPSFSSQDSKSYLEAMKNVKY